MNNTNTLATIALISRCKSNQQSRTKIHKYHTRFILAVIAIAIATFLLASCSGSRYDYSFDSNADAIAVYRHFLADVRSMDKAPTKDLAQTINLWYEVGDTVLHYIEKSNKSSKNLSRYYAVHDSVKNEMLRLVSSEERTLADVIEIKRNTSLYRESKDLKPVIESSKTFFASLDSQKIYKYDKARTLIVYRAFLREMLGRGINSVSDLRQMISSEDVIFRTYLSHINEYSDVPLSDITMLTESLCKSVYKNATTGKLDCREAVVLMAMRTNRRLLQNSEACINGFGKELSQAQQSAYYWMMLQPFISIDSFGMTVLSEKQNRQLEDIAENISTMEKQGKLGKHKSTNDISSIILKLYISAL